MSFLYEITPNYKDAEYGHPITTDSERMRKIAERFGWKVSIRSFVPESLLMSQIEMYESCTGKYFYRVDFIGGVVTRIEEVQSADMFWLFECFGNVRYVDDCSTEAFVIVSADSEEEAIKLAVDIMNQAQNEKSLYLN